MGFFQIFLIGVGLSMDAFAVSLRKGLGMKKVFFRAAALIGGVFGFFQAVMPLTGYYAGSIFSSKISQYSGYVTFIILVFLGINMIKEGKESSCECDENGCDIEEAGKGLLALGIATSIDALAVGFTFSLTEVMPNIFLSVTLIGIITFVISAAGVYMGRKFGTLLESKAQFLGGSILILLGAKSLLGVFL